MAGSSIRGDIEKLLRKKKDDLSVMKTRNEVIPLSDPRKALEEELTIIILEDLIDELEATVAKSERKPKGEKSDKSDVS